MRQIFVEFCPASLQSNNARNFLNCYLWPDALASALFAVPPIHVLFNTYTLLHHSKLCVLCLFFFFPHRIGCLNLFIFLKQTFNPKMDFSTVQQNTNKSTPPLLHSCLCENDVSCSSCHILRRLLEQGLAVVGGWTW